MTINIKGPELRELKPRILVLGVGGAGGNAINGMIEAGLQGVEFVAVNTDAQDLKFNKAHAKIQLGSNLTKGLGAGAKHEIGQAAAEESLNDIVDYIKGSNMVFITAGMGGGTGTGAAHVIARAAKELSILTVGVVTLPFSYEGPKKMRIALQGLEELKKHLDTNIVVPNQNLFRIINEKTTFKNSFGLSNDVLKSGVQSVTDLMVRPGLVNLDFADVETIMKGMGKAMMGSGEAEGETRVNITGGNDLTMFEVDQAVNTIRAEVDPEAELIFGSIEDENLNGKIRVSIVATSLDGQEPETKPVVSMIHRLHNRNVGYSNNLASTLASNQTTLNATEGATVLDINTTVERKEEDKKRERDEAINQDETFDNVDGAQVGNISLENATYLQNAENNNDNFMLEDQTTNFEVESIELATPQLFSDEVENNDHNLENDNTTTKIFDDPNNDSNLSDLTNTNNNTAEEKEPEMFKKTDSEEDFEIPAFLRRQKN